MTSDATAEIAANLERAEEALDAARALVENHFSTLQPLDPTMSRSMRRPRCC